MSDPTRLTDPRLRPAFATILAIVGLSAFEGLAIVAAIADIGADLGHVELLPWVASLYLLSSGVATATAGALVDRLGVARVFRVALALFVVGSAVCGFAPEMWVLVAGRALQGLGGGALNAASLTAVGLVFPRPLVGRAFAANSNVWGIMSVAGPSLAALLLTVASWRWIFWINIPACALVALVGWRALPEGRDDAAPSRLDPLDVLSVVGFSLLTLLAIDTMSWASLPLGLLTVAIAAVHLRRSRRRPGAMLAAPHSFDAPRGPLAWGIAAMLVGAIGVHSFLPVYLRGGRGIDGALPAWSVLFLVLGWTTGANTSSRVQDHVPAPRLAFAGAMLVCLSTAGVGAMAWVDGVLPLIFLGMFGAGFGSGFASNAGLFTVREVSADDELGRATSAHQFVRNLGFALGTALVGGVLLGVVGATVGDPEHLRRALEGGSSARPEVAAAVSRGFALGALTGSGVVALGLPLLWRVMRRADQGHSASTL